jgi:hypothetical protein
MATVFWRPVRRSAAIADVRHPALTRANFGTGWTGAFAVHSVHTSPSTQRSDGRRVGVSDRGRLSGRSLTRSGHALLCSFACRNRDRTAGGVRRQSDGATSAVVFTARSCAKNQVAEVCPPSVSWIWREVWAVNLTSCTYGTVRDVHRSVPSRRT